MSDYISSTDQLYRRLLESVYNSGAIPGYFGRSTADLYRRVNSGQPNVGERSQAIGQQGVEYGPPASAAAPAETLPTPPIPPQRSARPPVTSAAAPNTDSATNPADAAADTMRSLRAAAGADAPREGRDVNDRIANFGYAMAASRNPSLFGMIGEAGLAMQRGDREDRQDTRQEREIDVMQEYRRAQIQLAAAEQEWQRDPNNPLNVARLAEARYRLAAAANVGRSGSGAASEGPGIPIENAETGRFGIFFPRTGRIAEAPEGVTPMGAAANTPNQRRLTDWNNRRAEFERSLFQNPLFGTPTARDAALSEWVRRNPMPAVRGTGTGTGTDAIMQPQQSDRVRIPYTPPGR